MNLSMFSHDFLAILVVCTLDDSLEGLQSAFQALSVEEVDTNPVKRKREREKDAGESMADEE